MMNVSVRGATLATLLLSLVGQAWAGDLKIEVLGVHPGKGNIFLSVCDREHFMRSDCPYTAVQPSTADSVVFTFEGVHPGQYAVEYFQDENRTGRLTRGRYGVPNEGYGFSNDVSPSDSPPVFDDMQFEIADSPTKVITHIQYR